MSRDWAARRPLYLQLRDAFAERIAGGAWRPGQAIPNEQDLARETGVSPGTVRKALDVMEEEYLVTRQQGRGTFVNDQASQELAARFDNLRTADGARMSGEMQLSQIGEGVATKLECERLALGADATVYRVRRVRSHNAVTFMIEDASMPADLFPGLLGRREKIADVSVLARDYGILLGGAQERIAAAVANGTLATSLGIVTGGPVIVLDRVISMLGSERPVEWRIAHCRLDESYYLSEIR